MILFADKLAVAHIDLDDVACRHIACKDRARNERFDGALEISLQRTRAEHGVKAAVDDELLCALGDLKAEALVLRRCLSAEVRISMIPLSSVLVSGLKQMISSRRLRNSGLNC